MRAIGIPEFGGPDVLEVFDREPREPREGEVRIRVAAAAVNPTDITTRDGTAAAAYRDIPFPIVPGMDAAGTIDAVGPGVTRLAVGDEVMAAVLPRRPGPDGGAQAELIVVPEASAVPLPEGATLQEAATLPMNGLTAIHALDLLSIPSGGTLLITGGAGHLSALTIPLAKERGLRVLADARADERDLVAGYGADDVLERGDGLAARVRELVPDGVDAVLDAALLGPAIYAAVRDGGGYAAVRGFRGETERGIVPHAVWVAERLEDTKALLHLRELAGAGRLPLPVSATFPPEEVGEAHRRMEAGGVRGRLLIVF
ncbi:quinone oxidoreductase family protein [Patulibacter americanus]|uniref:quinone oxidoreductase family protein n=1 Tax=Patulibacter americanus TaxID=588672 RepID=UPI0003B3CDE0|nr:NADP-dependent oxidoreductase [Patulibacter americanus]